ncbi:hypothetical protein WJX74_000427 [Apatococcus lobatus]|uniref:Potassium channel tetramerisation-type BTB domain-containing protein n=1 Tax=Apatococcus lobatus TaxID=904363 RepID=A0AAW1RMH5_9CHLO
MQRNAQGQVFIDRDGEAFRVILEYLRAHRDQEAFVLPQLECTGLRTLWREATFYGLEELAQAASARLLDCILDTLTSAVRSAAVKASRSAPWDDDAQDIQDIHPIVGPSEQAALDLLNEIGGERLVVSALSSLSAHTQAQAAGAAWFLSCQENSSGPLEQEVMPSLIAYLSSKDHLLQENAAGALAAMARHEHIQKALVTLQAPVAMMTLVGHGSELAQGGCAHGLIWLAAGSSRGCFDDMAVLRHLMQLLSAPSPRVQYLSLQVFMVVLTKKKTTSTRESLLNMHGAIRALRGLPILKSHLQDPRLEDLAASCLDSMTDSSEYFDDAGIIELLFEKLKAPACPGSQATASKTARTQRWAASAIARGIADSRCDEIALQADNMQAILQLVHSNSADVWRSAVDAVCDLVSYQAASKQLVDGLVEAARLSLVDDVPPCHTAACCFFRLIRCLEGQPGLRHLVNDDRVISRCRWVLKVHFDNQSVQAAAAAALEALAIHTIKAHSYIWPELSRILQKMLQSSSVEIQIAAARALFYVYAGDAARASDIMPLLRPIVQMLAAPSSDVKHLAIKALHSFACSAHSATLGAPELGVQEVLAAMTRPPGEAPAGNLQREAQKCLDKLKEIQPV